MASFWKHVNRVLEEADIIIEVLDARSVEDTRNREIEDKIRKKNKKLIYVINKCDLVEKDQLEGIKKSLKPSVFVSSTEYLGTTMLKEKILQISHGENVTVGVLGYPNVGKSSLINALAGRSAARTSSESGYTKGLQKVRVDRKILLIDTPGVFPKEESRTKEGEIVKYGRTGAVSYAKIKDPEYVAMQLIEENKEKVKKYYHLSSDEAEELLEELALKLKIVRKGGLPDTESAARHFLREWQEGKVR